MPSVDNICQSVVPTLEPGTVAQLQQPPPLEASSQIGREVAHELNNILTIIQGYTERTIMKHGENPALRLELQLISDNARRAVAVIKRASPRRPVLA